MVNTIVLTGNDMSKAIRRDELETGAIGFSGETVFMLLERVMLLPAPTSSNRSAAHATDERMSMTNNFGLATFRAVRDCISVYCCLRPLGKTCVSSSVTIAKWLLIFSL